MDIDEILIFSRSQFPIGISKLISTVNKKFKIPIINGMGNDPFVDAAESAAFPLPCTNKRE